jgi:hypothetical protein
MIGIKYREKRKEQTGLSYGRGKKDLIRRGGFFYFFSEGKFVFI